MILLIIFQSMVLAGLFSGTVYGIGLAVVYKLIKNDNSMTTLAMIGSLIFGMSFFIMLLIIIKL